MLKNILAESSLQQCIGDEGCYVGTALEILLGTHVDDFLGIALSEQILKKIEQKIERHVKLEKRGKSTKMLRVEIEWIEYGIVLTQRNLIETTIEGHGIARAKPSLPIDRRWFEARDNTDKPCNQKQYQSIIGSLLYITRTTRPGISIHINLLGRRAQDHQSGMCKRHTKYYHI
jgi:hypothetical protein